MMPIRHRRSSRAGAWGPCLVLWLGTIPGVYAQTRESFEAAHPVMQLASRDCPLEIHEHGLCLEQAHRGVGSETMRFTAGQGEQVLWTYQLQPAHVIPEFEAQLWVRGAKPGPRLLLRVVLPHAGGRDGPGHVLLPGDSYGNVGAWQLLRVRDARNLLQQELVKHHAEHHKLLDIRDAYIDAVVINAYAGPGRNQIWVDELEVLGEAPVSLERLTRLGEKLRASQGNEAEPIRVAGDKLSINDKPRFVRAIRLHGEPLALASELGFNAVLIEGPPSQQLAQAAQQYGLWLIAPPPRSDKSQQGSSHQTATPSANELRVLAWWSDDANRHVYGTRPRLISLGAWQNAWHQRRADRDICLVRGEPWDYSRSLSEQGRRWREHLSGAAPSAPGWVVVPTEAPVQLNQQAALLGAEASSLNLSSEQIRLAAYEAVLSGARGLIFWSERRLDGVEEQTRRDSLRLINAELSRWEPWLAAGDMTRPVATADPLDQAGIWSTPRSQWLLVIRHAPDQEFVAGPDNETPLTLSLPPLSPSTQAFRLTEPIAHQQTSLTPLSHQRIAGGVRLRIADSRRVEVVLLSTDPLAVSYAARMAAETSGEIVRLRRRLTTQMAGETAEVHQRLVQLGHDLPGANILLEQARRFLDEARLADEDKQLQASDALVERAADRLTRLQLGHWRAAAAKIQQSGGSPFYACFALLPQHWMTVDQAASQHWAPLTTAADGWRSSPPIALASATTVGVARWLDSPPIAAPPGRLVRVSGKISAPLNRENDVWITDTATGSLLRTSLAADGSFLFYRVMPPAGQMTVRWNWQGAEAIHFEQLEFTGALPGSQSTDVAVQRSQ